MDHRFRDHIAWTSDHPMGWTINRAEGPFLFLADGRRVVDLISGIAVSSLGHGHPEVRKAVKDQVDRHMHVMVYGEMIQEPQVAFARLLAEQLPAGLRTIYLVNSGTEANEGALKLARKYTGRKRMIAFEGSYHGDTQGSLSVTGRAVYRNPYEPLLPNVTFLPFGRESALAEIDSETACVITEPIQGEGGVIVPSPEWHRALRDRCTETGALLIFDEIQTGFGRTGSLFAFEGFGVEPDIMTMAKAMGGGMPLGGIASSGEIMAAFRRDPPLSHVTTFGGHPVSCAAAHAALNVLLRDRLPDAAPSIESVVRAALEGQPGVVEVRGKGAMLGLALENAALTERVVQHAWEHGVLVGWTLHSDTLIRIAPPLTIERDVLSEALNVLVDALTA